MYPWKIFFILICVIFTNVNGASNYSHVHSLIKREDPKFKNSVPITYKGQFACSGVMASHRLVLTSSSCVKKGMASNYKVVVTDSPWRVDRSPIGFSFQVEKIIREPKPNGISLLQVVNFVKNAADLIWDATGKIQPWINKETVTLSGWEGTIEDNESDEDEESSENEEDSDEDDESGEKLEYNLGSFSALVDRLCPAATGDDATICITPKKYFECEGFKGGAVLSRNILVGIITDTEDCKRIRGVRIFPSLEWLKSQVPRTRSITDEMVKIPEVSIKGNGATRPAHGLTFVVLTTLVMLYRM